VGGKSWAAAGDSSDEGSDGSGGEEKEQDKEQEKGGKKVKGKGQNGRKGTDVLRHQELEMEVTYTPGLEGLGKRLLAAKKDKAAREAESVWDAYLRRRAEKRQDRKLLKVGCAVHVWRYGCAAACHAKAASMRAQARLYEGGMHRLVSTFCELHGGTEMMFHYTCTAVHTRSAAHVPDKTAQMMAAMEMM
jgi:hypothetical protein